VEHNADECSKKRQRGDYEDAQLDLIQSIRELVNLAANTADAGECDRTLAIS